MVYRVRDGKESYEPVFVNVYVAQESTPPAYVPGGPVRQYRLSFRLALLGIDFWAP
jgi:hypothetical protein